MAGTSLLALIDDIASLLDDVGTLTKVATNKTAGEGWHNNHHRFQRAARNGFYWWELDLTYAVIRAMSYVGLTWDLQPVPERIYREADARDDDELDAEVA
jgi:stearoyl-CoA desaturase (delta-9 desaturase)